MGQPGKRGVGIAVVLIVLGLGLPAAYQHWIDTRTFVVLDIPVSLSPGHIKTADFRVNLTGWYQIGIDGDEQFFYEPSCRLGAFDPLLKTRSTVYRDGRVLDTFNGADRFLGHFYAEKRNRYSMDIQVLTDAGCLNNGHPRILIWTPSAYYQLLYGRLLMVSIVLALCGLGILAFSITTLLDKQTIAQDQLPVLEKTGCNCYPPRRKLLLRSRLQELPPFGLVYALILASLLIPSCLIFLHEWGYDHRSVGIDVHLLKPGLLKTASDSWAEPLVGRVENVGPGSPPRLYLNSKLVGWEALAPELKTKLKSRSDWVVFIEADDDINWGDAVNAMDIIRGAGARVVLLTTRPPSLRP